MFYPTFSSFVASLTTSGPTMGRSLWPRLFRSGSQRSAPRLPTSHQAAPGRMVTSRASTHACEMNCSMVKSSTRCVRPKSSSKVGGDTSTQSGRMNGWTTSHQHRKCSCPPSLRGRLRYVDRLRRPRWRNGQLSTNIPPGPLDGGRSIKDKYPALDAEDHEAVRQHAIAALNLTQQAKRLATEGSAIEQSA